MTGHLQGFPGVGISQMAQQRVLFGYEVIRINLGAPCGCTYLLSPARNLNGGNKEEKTRDWINMLSHLSLGKTLVRDEREPALEISSQTLPIRAFNLLPLGSI